MHSLRTSSNFSIILLVTAYSSFISFLAFTSSSVSRRSRSSPSTFNCFWILSSSSFCFLIVFKRSVYIPVKSRWAFSCAVVNFSGNWSLPRKPWKSTNSFVVNLLILLSDWTSETIVEVTRLTLLISLSDPMVLPFVTPGQALSGAWVELGDDINLPFAFWWTARICSNLTRSDAKMSSCLAHTSSWCTTQERQVIACGLELQSL